MASSDASREAKKSVSSMYRLSMSPAQSSIVIVVKRGGDDRARSSNSRRWSNFGHDF